MRKNRQLTRRPEGGKEWREGRKGNTNSRTHDNIIIIKRFSTVNVTHEGCRCLVFYFLGCKNEEEELFGKELRMRKKRDDDERRALQTKRVRSWSLVTCFFYTFTGVVPVRRIVGGASFHGKSRDQCGRGLLVFYTFILNFYLRFSPFITHTDLHFSE